MSANGATVTGTGEAGATITITNEAGVIIGTALVAANGSYTVILTTPQANGQTLDDILVPAFATVREAAKRTLGQRHFDVQLIGGMVLHDGKIAEMKTGEGKTLMATLAAYLNALPGKGVHVVTVNDYLASRDAEWMGRLYRFLGLTVGCNLTISFGESSTDHFGEKVIEYHVGGSSSHWPNTFHR